MNQVWLITGSARGLGRAIAEAVLAAGRFGCCLGVTRCAAAAEADRARAEMDAKWRYLSESTDFDG